MMTFIDASWLFHEPNLKSNFLLLHSKSGNGDFANFSINQIVNLWAEESKLVKCLDITLNRIVA